MNETKLSVTIDFLNYVFFSYYVPIYLFHMITAFFYPLYYFVWLLFFIGAECLFIILFTITEHQETHMLQIGIQEDLRQAQQQLWLLDFVQLH